MILLHSDMNSVLNKTCTCITTKSEEIYLKNYGFDCLISTFPPSLPLPRSIRTLARYSHPGSGAGHVSDGLIQHLHSLLPVSPVGMDVEEQPVHGCYQGQVTLTGPRAYAHTRGYTCRAQRPVRPRRSTSCSMHSYHVLYDKSQATIRV